jgi:hypothetical protein
VSGRRTQATVVLVRAGAEVARWPLETSGRPGLQVVDELARLALAARRLGCSIRVRDPGHELVALLDLTGVGPVVGVPAPLVEVGGETEGGEQARVEEGVEPGHPVA